MNEWSAAIARTRNGGLKVARTDEVAQGVDAVTEYDVATVEMEGRPEDLNKKDTLLAAKNVLNQAREALRNSLRH